MTKVVTIVADKPPQWTAEPLNWDGNSAIELAQELNADRKIMRASVTDSYTTNAGLRCGLRDRFVDIQNDKELRGDSCIVQLLGHARPGQLALGYYWNNVYQGQPDSEYYSLDGNPRGYWRLAPWKLPENCEIWLLGCCVGQSSHYDAAGDGEALMYDLSHMLKRPVKAAAVEVRMQSDFDGRGLFTGFLVEAGRPTENAKQIRTALSLRCDRLSRVDHPPHITAVTGVPIVAPSEPGLNTMRIPVGDLSLSFPDKVMNPEPSLSLPDLDVAVTFDRGLTEWPGQIYSNGMYLRVRPPDLGPGHGHMQTFARSHIVFEDPELRQRVLDSLA